jgi:hypothetical protein
MSIRFVVLHWAPDQKGSGYTVVVASNETRARMMVWDHLCSKAEGYRQCGSSSLLQVEPLEDYSFIDDLAQSLPMQGHGVKAEYSLAHSEEDDEGPRKPVLVAYMPPDTSYLSYGGGGHDKEYLVNVAGHDHENYIPNSMSTKLAELLPGFDVCNRGSRIEVVGKKPYGFRDDDKVVAAVKAVVGQNLTVTL